MTSPTPPEDRAESPSPSAQLPPVTRLGFAALAASGLCTAWVAVEILLRVQRAEGWMITASFVVALVLAAVVVVLAIAAWRQDRRRGGVWGLLAIGMAASDRIFLALFTAFGGF